MAKPNPSDATIPAKGRNVRPRAPMRAGGVLRYKALIDTTEALLRDASTDEVGLYQIAEHAGVPPASVYHFFPVKEAAFLALAQRYLEEFAELARKPIPPEALTSWQSLMAWDYRLAMEHYNAHPPALKLFLGGFGGVEVRQADREHNARTAQSIYRRWDRFFHMPRLRDPTSMFHVKLQILDAVWTLSYLKHGLISEDFYGEALAASTAYCRLYLPEWVELRDEFKAPVARGESVSLRTE